MRILPCLVFPPAMLASLGVHAQSALPQPLALAPAGAVNPWLHYLPQAGYGGMSIAFYLMPMQMVPQAQPRSYTMRPVISEERETADDADDGYLMRMFMADVMNWVAGYESQLGISPELARGARDIRQRMGEIIHAAANGDL